MISKKEQVHNSYIIFNLNLSDGHIISGFLMIILSKYSFLFIIIYFYLILNNSHFNKSIIFYRNNNQFKIHLKNYT